VNLHLRKSKYLVARISFKAVTILVFAFNTHLFSREIDLRRERYFAIEDYATKVDSLRRTTNHRVTRTGNQLEIATMIALTFYPELADHKIKIKYKSNVKHPITASFDFSNLFKGKKRRTYVLLVHPESFVDRINLNKQVSLIGHEMGHFLYYNQRSLFGMALWGLKYMTSRKFRYSFEIAGDTTAISHGLGWQLLDMSIYLRRHEVLQYMEQYDFYLKPEKNVTISSTEQD